MEELKSMAQWLVMDANDHIPKIIAFLDACVEEWGSRGTNVRGCILLQAFSCLNHLLANTECVNTSEKAESMIDYKRYFT